jgi:predicted ATPase
MTPRFIANLRFGLNGYQFALRPTINNLFVFEDESIWFQNNRNSLGTGHSEAKVKSLKDDPGIHGAARGVPHHVYSAISNWVVYHFHDTSLSAGVRRQGPINHNERLHADASNLAAYLYHLQQTHPSDYQSIRDVVRLAAPFFYDFKLRPVPNDPNMIQLEWLQTDTSYPFLANQLSDGTLRFICLATALLQPSRPPTMLFDEPELGLHPYALTLLGNLFKQTSSSWKQVIISTQSALLLNEFAPEDIIVVERHQGESTFHRLDPTTLSEWLDEYTLGELWQKNVIGGRPRPESTPQLTPSETA